MRDSQYDKVFAATCVKFVGFDSHKHDRHDITRPIVVNSVRSPEL